nr:L-ribulose-5-phosphate 4-epimerase [Candidatus Collinsella stercoripullorum]
MMLKELREKVYEANMDLPKHGLVVFTWGNASEFDRESGLFVIKPSGVDYDKLSPESMVVCDLDGKVVDGDLNPSSDTPTHAYLYREWGDKIGGVVHTHSAWAVSWAQAGRDIPAYGTTHADYFYGPIPCMRGLTEEEIEEAYELNTGKVIVEGFAERDIDLVAVPAVLVRNHGPFTWGKDADAAVYHAVVLDEVAKMAARTEMLQDGVAPAPQYLQDKHYLRKHGPNAYYGQGGAH